MTGDYAVHGAQAQEFGAFLRASGVAFLRSSASLEAILLQTIAGGILPSARAVRLLRSVQGETY